MDKENRENKSVLLYTDWAKPLQSLPLEDVGRLFLGILSYTDTGEIPQFDNPVASMAFEFIRLRLDSNIEKWETVREKRRAAGALGGKQRQANQANATFAKHNQANQANQAVPVPVPVPVPVAAKAAIAQTSPDTPPEQPAAAPQQPPSLDGLETSWRELGLGRRMGPVVQQALRAYLAAGLEDALIVQAMREAAEHDVKATLPYIRSILDRCQAQGIHTLVAWQAAHRGGGGKRVDRETPSGSDFLADAAIRPRRHKRKG